MYKIFLDSNALLACLIKNDTHHKDVSSLLEFINEKYISQYGLSGVFIVNEIVILETISKLIHKKYTYKNSKRRIEQLLDKYKIFALNRGRNNFIQIIFKLYADFSRKKFKMLQCNDFLIMADSIKAKSLLVTCDQDFFKKTSKNYKNIYYVSSKSKKQRDQYDKLLIRFFNSISE